MPAGRKGVLGLLPFLPYAFGAGSPAVRASKTISWSVGKEAVDPSVGQEAVTGTVSKGAITMTSKLRQ